ncbi:hypothetical protein BV898_02748 [Hypsibius exemplaris]|uniref:Uncharacterized protein n=1 Tax=Hypsibius exemplaris TaxID=2072580 RepID=A0A1W0X6Y0_HYPEX|nr:hypothetical protein BV898_02748 [Hypsibius exemplaris]
MKLAMFLLLVSCVAITFTTLLVSPAAACHDFDEPCTGKSGTQGSCCEGFKCHKNNPTWREGRCYYIEGTK